MDVESPGEAVSPGQNAVEGTGQTNGYGTIVERGGLPQRTLDEQSLILVLILLIVVVAALVAAPVAALVAQMLHSRQTSAAEQEATAPERAAAASKRRPGVNIRRKAREKATRYSRDRLLQLRSMMSPDTQAADDVREILPRTSAATEPGTTVATWVHAPSMQHQGTRTGCLRDSDVEHEEAGLRPRKRGRRITHGDSTPTSRW
eukprot:TRINITY_DN74110_c0_g1_i1.p1 TRINITY_DN74110_c0_g1~~TRINITY_DN74110_c0_g1_i1.p1  ORF type:complete len:204 (-),score=14.90 TRINITY_DN74110_c0_g1_i1:670-1281(-)